MIFTETSLKGAFTIDLAPHSDERGFFARSFCRKEFEAHGLDPAVLQCNISLNHKKGTLRGMHFQTAPFEEVKIVRCTRGEIVDTIIDLRRESSTYLQWISVHLTENNHTMLYVPRHFAHGFQALADNTELMYQVSQEYSPAHATGVRFDDPAFGIKWPLPVSVISKADSSWPLYTPQAAVWV
ncbi:MAG TPA: dTDP-4-dehydrorhamnose 3,5-epimerase [Bacteroidota bacterium]|nr:dTDP-4-dehydrorhamnose 3,5-epimerase [Bacteroidota bacterium]